MKAHIHDKSALMEISPLSLAAYARASGWRKTGEYGQSSDVYDADDLPEIILPRHRRLGDYASVVSRVVQIFAERSETDELTLYSDLMTADRDVVRVRAVGAEDGSVSAEEGIGLVCGTRDMLLAAACSLREPRPVYRLGANKEAMEYLRRSRLGQTEQGSFVVRLLGPVVLPPLQTSLEGMPVEDPIERRIARRLVAVLEAVRRATESVVGGASDAFSEAMNEGVSANLCEALESLVSPFQGLDVSVSWARTYPAREARRVVRFSDCDAPILRQAALRFREQGPRPDTQLVGFVGLLKRAQSDVEGTISLRATIDDRVQSVSVVLSQSDYQQAIRAHEHRSLVMLNGDLERYGERWRLLNPAIVNVLSLPDVPEEGEESPTSRPQ